MYHIRGNKHFTTLLKRAMEDALAASLRKHHKNNNDSSMIGIMKIWNQYEVTSYLSLVEHPIAIHKLFEVSSSYY